MAQEAGMPCRNGIDGIFGIAFRQLDAAGLHALLVFFFFWGGGGRLRVCPKGFKYHYGIYLDLDPPKYPISAYKYIP